jgi:AcrR family transcriptional regulator
MMDLRVKGDQTKKRLIDACERLIAEKGFEGVSVRDITGMAKANVAAVNYHFGSREGLLDAVLVHRIKPLLEARMAALSALGAKVSLRELFQAWASPLLDAEAAKGNDEIQHARLLGRCLEKLLAGKNESIMARYQESENHLTDAIMRVLGSWEREDVTWRLHFCHGALVGGLVYGSALLHPFHRRDVVEKWLDSCVAQWGQSERSSRRDPRERKVVTPVQEVPSAEIAEVVADVMSEIDQTAPVIDEMGASDVGAEESIERPSEVSEVTTEPQGASVGLESSTVPLQAAPSPKSKKRKASEDTGELFLF